MISANKRAWLLALGAIGIVQLAYWFVLSPLLFSYPPVRNVLDIDQVEVATLDRPEFALVESTPRRRIEFGDHQCCGPGYRAFVFVLKLDSVPREGLAYASTLGADNIQVYVNGSMVRGEGRMALPDITYHNNRRTVVHIPAGLLRTGSNQIVNIVVRDHIPWFDVYRPLVGPYNALREDISRRAFMLTDYKLISVSIGVVLGILALLICVRREQRRFGLWIVLLLSAWTLRTLYYMWTDSPLHGVDRLSYYFLLTLALPLAWVNVVNEWTENAWPWLRRLTAAIFLVLLVALLYALRTDAVDGYDRAATLSNVLGIVCAGGALLRLLQHLRQNPDDRRWERAVLLLCIVLVGVEFAQELLFEFTNGQMQTSLPLLMVVFAIAFARGNTRLLQLANDFNSMLSGKLAQRETELSESHRRETELVRRETLAEERKRLMLDMHDGVVGQLAGLQHAARQGAISGPELADGVESVIDELRLIIDSLDSAGANFSNAFANYRSRIEPRLTAIGIQSHWRNDLPIDADACKPETVLHSLRILQEAVTNAIKYARTARLDIACWLNSDPSPRVNLSIRDHGTGLDSQATPGRGLANMQARAAAIGAKLRVSREQPGTLLVLELPAT